MKGICGDIFLRRIFGQNGRILSNFPLEFKSEKIKAGWAEPKDIEATDVSKDDQPV